MKSWALRARKKADRLAVFWTARLLLFTAKFLPYRAGILAGGCIGGLAFFLLPRERRRAIEHLKTAFPEKTEDWIHRTARASFIHLGKSLLEILLMNPVRLSRSVVIEGMESLQQALSRGKGVVFVTGHIGNWELMGQAVARLSTLSVVAAPMQPEPVNDMIVGLRAKMGVRTILRGRPGSSRELIRVFKENRILGILIDQDTDVESAFVDFMGRPARTPTAAASMALKFNAPLLFGYIERDRHNRHRIRMEGPIDLFRSGDDEKDIVANTALLTKKIEESIMKNPEQWVWMHRRWRSQP